MQNYRTYLSNMKETYFETSLKSIYLISPSHTHLCSSPRSWLDNWVRSDLIRPAVFFCLFLLSGFGVQKNWCSRYKKYFFTLSKLTIVLSLFPPPNRIQSHRSDCWYLSRISISSWILLPPFPHFSLQHFAKSRYMWTYLVWPLLTWKTP